jgi:hypothetical protein
MDLTQKFLISLHGVEVVLAAKMLPDRQLSVDFRFTEPIGPRTANGGRDTRVEGRLVLHRTILIFVSAIQTTAHFDESLLRLTSACGREETLDHLILMPEYPCIGDPYVSSLSVSIFLVPRISYCFCLCSGPPCEAQNNTAR